VYPPLLIGIKVRDTSQNGRKGIGLSADFNTFKPAGKQGGIGMELILIAIIGFAGAMLTFFSGFGLGTLMLPVFMLFFPVPIAVALTAVVHLLNNLFKAGLMGRYADWSVVLGFGLAALPGAWLGAWLLRYLTEMPKLYVHSWLGISGEVTVVKLCIAGLMMVFAILEVLPDARQPVFGRRALPLGGLLSGFFGGISGHQGALRSAFLIRLGLTKETFIASGILIACGIDLVRIGVYFQGDWLIDTPRQWLAMGVGASAAMAGALVGKRLLRKVTLRSVHLIVAIGITLMAIGLGVGWI
jgi:uncharacterized membrane protein YfcA